MKKLLTAVTLLAATTFSTNTLAGNCQYYTDQGNYWGEMSLTLMVAGYGHKSKPVLYALSRASYWHSEAAKCKAQQ